jgi:hypothetical protein
MVETLQYNGSSHWIGALLELTCHTSIIEIEIRESYTIGWKWESAWTWTKDCLKKLAYNSIDNVRLMMLQNKFIAYQAYSIIISILY